MRFEYTYGTLSNNDTVYTGTKEFDTIEEMEEWAEEQYHSQGGIILYDWDEVAKE